jgi:hypothetical protein
LLLVYLPTNDGTVVSTINMPFCVLMSVQYVRGSKDTL